MAAIPVGLSVYSGLGADTFRYIDRVGDPFESLWFPDHLQSNAEGVMEGWSLLVFGLARYPSKLCGHQVLNNEFRDPAILAKMVATVQVLSEGRFVLGLGAGWHRAEAVSYGMEFPNAETRVDRMIEAIDLMRALWTGGPVSFAGQHYRVAGAEVRPPPSPIPPVMIGGSGERHALRGVAARADWWNHIFTDLGEFTRKRSVLDEHCERFDRDPSEIVSVLATQVLIAESEAELERLRDRDDVRSIDRNGIAGTPDQVLERIMDGINAGARRIIVGFADSPRTDGAVLFAESVLGKIRHGV